MNNLKEINMDTYKRAELLKFYQTFDRPCFNILSKAKARKLYFASKMMHESFFLMSVYGILKAVNDVPELRMRLVDGKAVIFDKVDCCTPINIDGENFVEVILPYFENFSEFKSQAKAIIAEAKRNGNVSCQENTSDRVLISCVPWFSFDGYTCPELDTHQDMPIITYGKLENGKISVSLKASHYFMDGIHVARFFEAVNNNFKNINLFKWKRTSQDVLFLCLILNYISSQFVSIAAVDENSVTSSSWFPISPSTIV